MQFRLRTVFIFIVLAAIISEISRLTIFGESPFLLAVTLFGIGGIFSILLCAFLVMLGIAVAREAETQRITFVAAGAAGGVTWVVFLLVYAPMPMSFVLSCVATFLLVQCIRAELAAADSGRPPEETLQRLKSAKTEVRKHLYRE